MSPGRRPKPTEIKRLTGNPGGRPLNDKEPKFSGKPAMPPLIAKTPEAKLEWERVTAELEAVDILKATDQAMFTAYCMEWARYLQAQEEVSRDGATLRVLKTNKAGDLVLVPDPNKPGEPGKPVEEVKRHPATIIASDALKQLRALATSFGFDPSARSRIQLNPDQKEIDPFDQFLNDGDDGIQDIGGDSESIH